MIDISLLSQIQWRPTIGDPTIMGWVTVVAYFMSAAVTLKLYASAQELFPAELVVKQKQFWLSLALIMFCLGINKQLDLQSLLTAIGRYFAHKDGWYEQRRVIQVVVIIGIIASLLVAMLFFMIHFLDVLKTNWLALVGLTFLLLFIIVRATSFHHMDSLINFRIFNMRMNWLLELGGIASIVVPGVVRLASKEVKN